jgi:hypothetical protein
MSELGQDARSIVAQARAEGGPSAADRARIRAKLEPAWEAFRARQASGESSRAAAAPARRPLPWSAFALLLSLTLWPGEKPRLPPLGDLAALQPMAATGAAHQAARALQRMASDAAASSVPAAGTRGGLASASHDSSARGASLAGLLAHDAEGSVAARADSQRRAQLPNAASRSAPGAGAQAPSSAHGAAAPTARPSNAPRAANADRSATTAHATNAPRLSTAGLRATAASATAIHAPRAANASRTATTAGATAPDRSRIGPLPGAASPDAPTSSASEAPLAPSSTVRGGDMAEAGDATPSQRNPGFVPQPLDDELEWIGAAQDALRKGQPSSVLRLVQEHAFRYPQGALAPERLALQALALCALQRRAAARTVLADLARRTPSSPLLDRVQRSCGL